MTVKVLQAAVQWRDGYENAPDLTFLLDRQPSWETYEKRPATLDALSAKQEAIIGGGPRLAPPGWHVYWSEDDSFVWFFTWGGKPDGGFGGWHRTVTLSDGTTEAIVGGWHSSSGVAEGAGFPAVVDVGFRTDLYGGGRLDGGTACFVTEDRFVREVDEHLPDVEVVESPYGLTVKWRGQPSKAEFMAVEHARRSVVRDALKAKYHDGSWHNSAWSRRATREELAELDVRPYSALGALVER